MFLAGNLTFSKILKNNFISYSNNFREIFPNRKIAFKPMHFTGTIPFHAFSRRKRISGLATQAKYENRLMRWILSGK